LTQEQIDACLHRTLPENGLDLDLPPVNPFLPKKFEIEKNVPQLLRQWEESDLWYMQDTTFQLPKAYIGARIYTSDCGFGSTEKAHTLAHLWKSILKEHLNEFAYMGECAELDFELSVLADCIEIQWNGYNDSMPAFVSGLME
jgi:secreted Zn-dependent insulinase-like peptidase